MPAYLGAAGGRGAAPAPLTPSTPSPGPAPSCYRVPGSSSGSHKPGNYFWKEVPGCTRQRLCLPYGTGDPGPARVAQDSPWPQVPLLHTPAGCLRPGSGFCPTRSREGGVTWAPGADPGWSRSSLAGEATRDPASGTCGVRNPQIQYPKWSLGKGLGMPPPHLLKLGIGTRESQPSWCRLLEPGDTEVPHVQGRARESSEGQRSPAISLCLCFPPCQKVSAPLVSPSFY